MAKAGGKIKLLSQTEYYAPENDAPSQGTPHYKDYQYSSDAYSNTSPTAETFYTVTLSGLPATARAVFITGRLGSATSGYNDKLLWRPYGSSDTYAQSEHRQLGTIRGNTSWTNVNHIYGLVEVDSSGRFEVAVGNANTDIYIHGWTHYLV